MAAVRVGRMIRRVLRRRRGLTVSDAEIDAILSAPPERDEVVFQVVGRDLFGSQTLRQDLAERDPDESAFFTVRLVGAEMDNGGFAQLFTSSTGELVLPATVGARRLGLEEHARILDDASRQLFPDGVPLGHPERLEAWDETCERHDDDSLDEMLESLDQRWYALNRLLEKRLAAYAASRTDL